MVRTNVREYQALVGRLFYLTPTHCVEYAYIKRGYVRCNRLDEHLMQKIIIHYTN